MFCPICGFQRPTVDKFCEKCGSQLEGDGSSAVLYSKAVAASKIYCIHCGHQCEPSQLRCGMCGEWITVLPPSLTPRPDVSPAENIPNLSSVATAVQLQLEPSIAAAQLIPTSATAPYAQFVFLFLISMILMSVIAFNGGDCFARAKWNSTFSTLIAAILCCLFLLLALKAWRILQVRFSANEHIVQRRKVLSRCICFGILFIIAGATLGTAIGTSGAETDHFIADISLMSVIGDRISQARNSIERTVPANIAMYKSIEADVTEWDSVVRRMQSEVNIYNKKYPGQSAKIERSIEIAMRRADLLRHQIAVAKEIEPLEPAAQWNAWQKRMQPLIDQEDNLGTSK